MLLMWRAWTLACRSIVDVLCLFACRADAADPLLIWNKAVRDEVNEVSRWVPFQFCVHRSVGPTRPCADFAAHMVYVDFEFLSLALFSLFNPQTLDAEIKATEAKNEWGASNVPPCEHVSLR